MTTAPDVVLTPWWTLPRGDVSEVLVNGRRVGFAREATLNRWSWSTSLHKALAGTDHRGTMDELRAWAAGRAE